MKKSSSEPNLADEGTGRIPPPIPANDIPKADIPNSEQFQAEYPQYSPMSNYQHGPGPFGKFVAAMFLNLNGFGVGYFWMGNKLLALAEVLGTVGILILSCLTLTEDNKIILLAILVGWCLAHGIIGGILSAGKEGFGIQPSTGFLLLIALGIFVVEGGLFMGMRMVGSANAEKGASAYRKQDYEAASRNYGLAAILYKMTFSEEAFVADQRGRTSRLVVEIQRLINEGKYESIPTKVEELVGLEPAITVTGHDLGMQAALSKAEKEIEAGKFSDAEDTYQEAILAYYRSGNIDDAKAEFYQMMVDWADQLRKEANYQSAMTVYKRILVDLDTIEKSDPEFVRLIGQNYMDLTDQYAEKANYQAALDTLLEFTRQYPTANFSSALRMRFPDIYLRLARQQFEDKEYADAVANFETVLANYPGTTYGADAKTEIVDAYLGLGDQLAENGKDLEAYDAYMKAMKLNISDAEKARVALALGGILLNIGKDYLSTGDYINAELSLREAKGYAEDETLKNEISTTLNVVITSLADNTGLQGQQVMSEAVANACSGEKATSDAVNFHRDQDGKALSCTAAFALPSDLIAATPGELRYVVTVESGTEELGACSQRYYSYYGSFSYTLYRARYKKTVTIRSAESGNVYETRTFYGSYPGSCPYSYYFSTFGKTYMYGGEVDDDEITNWLEWKIR